MSAWRRGHRTGASQGTGSAAGSLGQVNATLARDLALNNAYSELGKELFSSSLKSVGNYSLGRVIGEGSFASVRLGLHRLTNTRVAIKQISRASAPPLLTREIHHHRRLHHPHICQLFEILASESSIYLVSELCPGGELFDYLVENGTLSELEARRIVGQLFVGLGYCHSMGVVHRDLKLENVLLNEYCDVKLADFGFGREYDRNRLMETFCGTTGYAPPEMLAGQKYRAEEVDIWSAGIIMYALLTGFLPFDDDDEEVMKRKVMSLDYEIPPGVSDEARDLISKILVLEPRARPSISDILAHAWFTKTFLPPSASMPVDMHLSGSAMTFDSPQPPIPEEELSPSGDSYAPSPLAGLATDDSTMTSFTSINTATELAHSLKSAKTETREPPSGRPSSELSLDETDVRAARATLGASRSAPHSASASPALPPPPHSRTPSRTKRRSVSSLHTLSERAPRMVLPNVDYFGMLERELTPPFTSPEDEALLKQMDLLGFDVGQVRHSVINEACDATGALWWILKRKQEQKKADPDNESLAGPKGVKSPEMKQTTSAGTTAPQMSQSASLASIGAAESETSFSFTPLEINPPRTRVRSNSALPATPSQPPKTGPRQLVSSPSSPSLSQQFVAQAPLESDASPKVAKKKPVGLGIESLGQPPVSQGDVSPKPRSASISILQRATSALVGSSASNPPTSRPEPSPQESSSVGGRTTPLGIFFGRKSSLGSDLPTAPPSPDKAAARSEKGDNATDTSSGAAAAATTVLPRLGQELENSPPVGSESSHETQETKLSSQSQASLGTSPASSSHTHGPTSDKLRHKGNLFSNFKLWFNEDRRRRKRSTAPALTGFEGSSVAKLRVAPVVAGNSARRLSNAESPLRQPIASGSSSASHLPALDAGPADYRSRASSISSANPAMVPSERRRRTYSDSSQRSGGSKREGDHTPSELPSRPVSVASVEGATPLAGQRTRRRRSSARRHKRSGSASSANSRGSEGQKASFRRGPTTATQVRRIERSRPHLSRRNSASSSVRTMSSRPSSISEDEFDSSHVRSKDQPVIEEENETEDPAPAVDERQKAFDRLSATTAEGTRDAQPMSRDRSASGGEHGTIFAAHKSTSVFQPPLPASVSRSTAAPRPKLRDVFANKASKSGVDDEWEDEEDILDGFSSGFGQASSTSKGSALLGTHVTADNAPASMPMLGSNRYASVSDAVNLGDVMPGAKKGGNAGPPGRQNMGIAKPLTATVEEEEEEEE